MSTHRVEVVRINHIEKHPNADSLGLVQIEGFTAIVRLGDFQPGDLAVYIEPDYVVPDNAEFAFLQGKTRIKARRLRGVWSQGLMIKAPHGVSEGECVMQRMGITRYEPPMVHQRGPTAPGGKLGASDVAPVPAELSRLPTYDLENWRKHRSVFDAGEPVVITEKIHGANARYCFMAGKMHVGSRNRWVKSGEPTWLDKLHDRVRLPIVRAFPSLVRRWRPRASMQQTGNVWWRALRACPWIETFCRANPGAVLYGEVFGAVQDLKYGAQGDQVFFRAFDVMKDGQFVDAERFNLLIEDECRAPVLYVGPYDQDAVDELSRMKRSTLADHIAEGVVIKPVRERSHPRVGRVALKLVSDLYLERS